MDGAAPQLSSVKPGVDPKLLAVWKLPRLQVEALYATMFQKNDMNAVRWFAQNDRYFLLTCLLRRPDCRHEWIFQRVREVEADPDDHLDLWFREGFKSTIISFGGVIQEILNNPEIRIGIFSHDRPAAKAFLSQIKLEFEDNEKLKEVFPDICWPDPLKQSPRWSEEGGIIVKRKGNPKEATVESWGVVDGQPTGRHFDLLVYDDLVTVESVTTPEQIRKTNERYDLSENLGTRGGRRWMVGTRYHYGDSYAALISRGVKERRHPATDDGTFDGKPVFFTPEEWEKRKQAQRSIVAAQMLLNPLAGAETVFDIRWLKTWEIRPKLVNVYILCDPSKGRTTASDETAISVIAIDRARNKYLIDGWRHRMNLSDRWRTLRGCWEKYVRMSGVLGVTVGYEQFGIQTDLEYFEERMEIEKVYFPIEELAWPREGQASKKHRIERLEPDVRMGRFKIPATVSINDEGQIATHDILNTKTGRDMMARGEKFLVAQPIRQIDEDKRVYDVVMKLIEEMKFFPYAARDDFLDATSRIYDIQPVPPTGVDRDGRGDSTEPETFVDGI